MCLRDPSKGPSHHAGHRGIVMTIPRIPLLAGSRLRARCCCGIPDGYSRSQRQGPLLSLARLPSIPASRHYCSHNPTLCEHPIRVVPSYPWEAHVRPARIIYPPAHSHPIANSPHPLTPSPTAPTRSPHRQQRPPAHPITNSTHPFIPSPTAPTRSPHRQQRPPTHPIANSTHPLTPSPTGGRLLSHQRLHN